MKLTLLFNPTARVYTLRLLLLGNIATIVFLVISFSVYAFPSVQLAIACSSLTLLHHSLILFPRRMRRLAAVDIALLIIETGLICDILSIRLFRSESWPFLFGLQFLMLLLSALFRCATIVKSEHSFFRQPFDFLGGCKSVRPRYTPLSILLNRSISRPLVRGESAVIIFTRAVILSCLALGVPAFAIYAILILPAFSKIYTRAIVTSFINDIGYPTDNVTVFLFGLAGDISNVSSSNIQVNAHLDSDKSTNCSSMDSSVPGVDLVVQCPHGWYSVDSVSISVGTSAVSNPLWRFGELGLVSVSLRPPEKYINSPPPPFEPIVLLPGSNLFGVLTWTERRVIEIPAYPTYVSTFIPEITSLQPYPSNGGGSDVAKLTLLNRYAYSTKLLEDTTDASPLSGISTLGGFWSFVNGAFALIFGRRPLSALGVVHIFQRRALARQWHRDFPALHSEGGRPGSDSAGIVAFIRERLVDLDSDSEHDDPSDLETAIGADRPIFHETNMHVDGESMETEDKTLTLLPTTLTSRSRQSGYLLNVEYETEEVQLPSMDMDLGLCQMEKKGENGGDEEMTRSGTDYYK
ncbi:hypothetical protein B0H13DRAFT_2265412 [Mycena leptocephala]|nr:hypothetical protein B0H13DRAFT_2265412 [Mycena leptocephala]